LGPVLGTHYFGLPIGRATVVTLLGLVAAFAVFEHSLVLAFRFSPGRRWQVNDQEFSPHIGRRALLLGGLGILLAGGGAGLLRKLYGLATSVMTAFSTKAEPFNQSLLTTNFIASQKNVVDPQVNPSFWRLEITGLGQNSRKLSARPAEALPAVTQEQRDVH